MREELDKADSRLRCMKRDAVHCAANKLSKLGYREIMRSTSSRACIRTYESKQGLDVALVIDHSDYEENNYQFEVKSTDPTIVEHFDKEVNFIQPYVDAYLQKLSEFQTYRELAGEH